MTESRFQVWVRPFPPCPECVIEFSLQAMKKRASESIDDIALGLVRVFPAPVACRGILLRAFRKTLTVLCFGQWPRLTAPFSWKWFRAGARSLSSLFLAVPNVCIQADRCERCLGTTQVWRREQGCGGGPGPSSHQQA